MKPMDNGMKPGSWNLRKGQGGPRAPRLVASRVSLDLDPVGPGSVLRSLSFDGFLNT
jgi:hypothetical protein